MKSNFAVKILYKWLTLFYLANYAETSRRRNFAGQQLAQCLPLFQSAMIRGPRDLFQFIEPSVVRICGSPS